MQFSRRQAVPVNALEMQLVSAVQRFNTLQRRADEGRNPQALISKTLAELGTALEELRVTQEQLIESRLRMEQLQGTVAQQYERYRLLFDEMPDAYLVTNANAAILEVNKAGAELFNVSRRFLVGKTMSVFVCEDRARFIAVCETTATESGSLDLQLRIRPRERAPVEVSARVSAENGSLRWVLRPLTSQNPV